MQRGCSYYAHMWQKRESEVKASQSSREIFATAGYSDAADVVY
jgi:hypothetical protein